MLHKMETMLSMEEFYADGCVKLNKIRGLEQCTELGVFNVAWCSELEELPRMETLESMKEIYEGGVLRNWMCEGEEHKGIGAVCKASSAVCS